MYRFHDWMTSLRPDFWTTFYKHPELLELFSFIHGAVGSSTGYKYLAAYDIVDIGEHNPGHTVSWSPIQLGEYTYVEGVEYPHQYAVQGDWIYIDCLYDRHVDPTVWYQNVVDFRYENSKLCFVKEPTIDTFLVSKGLVAGTRLAEDFGIAFGYDRIDSYQYRDTMVPLTAMFYRGPSIHNIVAAANLMISNPVAKYGDEVIIKTDGGIVYTDKYRYDLGSARLAVNVGSTVTEHQPFADVIEFSTDKITPGWWYDRIPRLFQKYKVNGAISKVERDRLMENYLKYFLAHIRINLNKTDWRKYEYHPDIWQLILDASPVRTDYILSMYWHQEDYDLTYPTFDVQKLKLTAHSMWSNRDIGENVESWLYAPREAARTIYPDGTTDVDWFVGSKRYRILDTDKKFQEFWSSEPKQLSYVEPHICQWYCRNTGDPNIPLVSKKAEDITLRRPDISLGKVVIKRPVESQVISTLEQDATYNHTSFTAILGEQNIYHEDLDDWTYYNNVHLGINGLVLPYSSTGYAISNAMPMGLVPKRVKVRVNKTLAANTSITMFWSTDASTWTQFSSGVVLTNISGNLYFKAVLTSSSIASPVFQGLDLSIRV